MENRRDGVGNRECGMGEQGMWDGGTGNVGWGREQGMWDVLFLPLGDKKYETAGCYFL